VGIGGVGGDRAEGGGVIRSRKKKRSGGREIRGLEGSTSWKSERWGEEKGENGKG